MSSHRCSSVFLPKDQGPILSEIHTVGEPRLMAAWCRSITKLEDWGQVEIITMPIPFDLVVTGLPVKTSKARNKIRQFFKNYF